MNDQPEPRAYNSDDIHGTWEERMRLPDPLPDVTRKAAPLDRTGYESLLEIAWPGYKERKDEITIEQLEERMRQLVAASARNHAPAGGFWQAEDEFREHK